MSLLKSDAVRVSVVEDMSTTEKFNFLRSQKLGVKTLIPTPNFSEVSGLTNNDNKRTLLHLDYTASAQGLEFIENYLKECMALYANTHTETSETGRVSTTLFHDSLESIRTHVGAPKESFVIPVGYGATGAIERIQKILGIYMSPKGQRLVKDSLNIDLQKEFENKFVVFVGPYEHHSNDVTWQDNALCKFVRIKALKDEKHKTEIDLENLREELKKYPNHIKMGSFSAASNVTGIKTDLRSVGKVLKEYGAMFFVDYAASAPYADIEMERDGIDVIYLSCHKNLGGTNLGILVGRNNVYDTTVSPTFGGGGTVSAVTPWGYYFHDAIEEREYSGTPAIKLSWQAALSFQLKDWIGSHELESVEYDITKRFMDFFKAHDRIEVLGNKNPEKRIPIFSFLVDHGNRKLHHNLVAALLNDLFGIQARSGCACAGPFGHELLAIDQKTSDKFVDLILNIQNGFKPGWTRIGAHYTLSETEIEYTFKALNGVAWLGPLFLDEYDFNCSSGEWIHKNRNLPTPEFGILSAIKASNKGLYPKLSSIKEVDDRLNIQFKLFLEESSARVANLAAKALGGRFARATWLSMVGRMADALGNLFSKKIFTQDELLTSVFGAIEESHEFTPRDLEVVKNAIQVRLTRPEDELSRFEEFTDLDPQVRFFYAGKKKIKDLQSHDHVSCCRSSVCSL